MNEPTPSAAALRVLFATAEITPWVKTGGLGDVSAALPPALAASGCEVRVLVPAYPSLKAAFLKAPRIATLPVLATRIPEATLIETDEIAPGVRLWLLDCPTRYDRPGNPYHDAPGHEWPDNVLRFGLLSRAAAWLGEQGAAGWKPDIVHCNDWHTALAPAFRKYLGGSVPMVVTVHNMAFHGLYPATTLGDLGLPPNAFTYDGVEFHGQLSFLKAGLQLADRITTVSPTYAREVQTDAFGAGLEGLLRFRGERLTGILNGIDDQVWNPSIDPLIFQTYSADALARRAANREGLQRRLGMEASEAPLLGVVSRLTHQKGSDLILDIADQLVADGCRLAVLGSGDKRIEKAFSELAHRFPKRCIVIIGYEEGLAHQIEAGVDLFLMPSLFEPCGLNQMYSLRYGTPPVVRRTGGLADTVVDTTPETLAAGTANGFVFDDPTPAALLDTIRRATRTMADPAVRTQLQRTGMRGHFSWTEAAEKYLDVFRAAMADRAALR